MRRAKKQATPYYNVVIENYAAQGKSIAHIDGKAVFVYGAVAGDIADIAVYKSKKDWSEAYITRILRPSPDRRAPFCAHFGDCGGCQWQHLAYEQQVACKLQEVQDNFTRIGDIPLPQHIRLYPSPLQKAYRNLLEFSFSAHIFFPKSQFVAIQNRPMSKERMGALGFHAQGFFDKVVPIERCHLMDDAHNDIRNGLYRLAVQRGYSFYNTKEHKGLLRTLRIRKNQAGKYMLLLSFGEESAVVKDIMAWLKNTFPFIHSLYYTINTKKNDALHDLTMLHYSGLPYLEETLHNLRFKIGPTSFFQTNYVQAEKLYAIVVDFVRSFSSDRLPVIYDLYCGTGTIAMILSRYGRQVIGVENNKEAVASARLSTQENNINNVTFVRADALAVTQADWAYPPADIVVVNPPRAGMHTAVIETLLKMQPSLIVYVSCNSATQARDLALLHPHYSIRQLAVVDMFPHTQHIESIVQLIRNEY